MSDYGVTNKGFVRKRYDTIYSEVQEDLKEKTGVDVAVNPKSLINVLLSSFCDKISQLWEVAEGVYLNHYPSTAEGINLDYACQFGGVSRQDNSRTKYTVLCTGVDGTDIPLGTRIASNTNPVNYFTVYNDYKITRDLFNKAEIDLLTVADGVSYTVYLNGIAYSYLSGTNATKASILAGLAENITDDAFTVAADGNSLKIASNNARINHELKLSDNMTTISVSTLIVFQSEDYGEIVLPEGAIDTIVTTLSGFASCSNLDAPVYGRLRETDVEYRQSYLAKRNSRSSSMLDSIASAIIQNVADVNSCTVYENSTNATDSEGRPAHSIEVVVDGGSASDIAQQIFKTKAAGIQTYGNVAVDVPGLYSDTITVRFNRPVPVYVWLKVKYTLNPTESVPPNAEDLIKETILDCTESLKAGDTVVLQKFIGNINNAVTGLAYIEIKAFKTTDKTVMPEESDYTLNYVSVTTREKASFASDRIEVVCDD